MEKIDKLKKIFKRENIDGYIVPKNDEFFSEYIPDHNDRLNFISNFSGSYGFAIILKDKNYLFVDGRYTLQASKQSGKFFKIITIPDKMPADVFKSKKFQLVLIQIYSQNNHLNMLFGKSKCTFKPLINNLIDEIWSRKVKKKKINFLRYQKSQLAKNTQLKLIKFLNF